jgi:glycosyltransferase involved in cell wall biosynthesis
VKISVITPNYNGERYLAKAIESVLAQREAGVDLEYIIVDGGSTDGSLGIIERFRDGIDIVIREEDGGPADAINKGLAKAGGEVVSWLNADDLYFPGALKRVAGIMAEFPKKAFCFGHCPIVDDEGREIRKGITKFKELFYPISSRFAIQSINFLSQPATFFRRSACEAVGPLRTDMVAAWDYDFLLRLWNHGGAVRVRRPALAAFRWHEASISGRHFRTQFREDWEVAAADAGTFSPQSILHFGVWWGIVWAYTLMAFLRDRKKS